MNWLLRLWPWHEHLYELDAEWDNELRLEIRDSETNAVVDSASMIARARRFRCRCGHTISGDDLFPAHTMMGKHWRERFQGE